MDITLKIIFVGDSGGGKTTINRKFITGKFEGSVETTVGAIYGCTHYKLVDAPPIKIQFWDTAGQERFRSIIPLYYKGSSAIIFVYDITNLESFGSIVNYWTDLIEKENYLKIFLIGNKKDLECERKISTNMGIEFAKKHNFDFFEISAKKDNLEIILSSIVNSIIKKMNSVEKEKWGLYGINTNLINETKNDSICC